MIRLRAAIAIICALLAAAPILSASGMKWEEVNDSTVRSFIHLNPDTKSTDEEEGVEMFTRDGYIYVSTDHEITVRVFSILGQLIGEGRLAPGVYRMHMKSRGIYIIKAGMATVRVTL